jgi:hypothetical protein
MLICRRSLKAGVSALGWVKLCPCFFYCSMQYLNIVVQLDMALLALIPV